jgi:GGDEF domain-containing protein
VTISAGVAVFPDNGRLASELLKAADVALYVAKGRGRNCVSEGLAA